MNSPSPEFEDWKARALAIDIVDAANARGAKLKRAGQEWVGPCPACGGTDRFSIHPGKRVFNCGHQGGAGGDVIAMVQHLEAIDFMQAVEILTGEEPPRGKVEERDPEIERERREERRDCEIERADQERVVLERRASASERLWELCVPIQGTHADAYLRKRRIILLAEQATDLRFCPFLAYEGHKDAEAQDAETLGHFPAMMAAIRDVAGALIGVHRTYLDPSEPKKLVPPGDRKRNKAKKVLGAAKHGAIWLGPVRPAVAMGEGIETTLSWFQLCIGPDDVTPIAGISLGNMAGGSTGSIRHEGRTISNGYPDPDKPGVLLPSEVQEVTMLGDGDSHRAFTFAALMTGAMRYRASGLTVNISVTPDINGRGSDWNDYLMTQDVG